MLTILGLGPGDPTLLTRAAWDALNAADVLHLRTRKHPTVAGLPNGKRIIAYDRLYSAHARFEDVYAAIVQRVMRAAGKGDVLYCVPGHPLVGESTTPALLKACAERGIATRIISGLSFIEPVLEHLARAGVAVDPIDGLQISDALQIGAAHHPALNPDKPALISQIYSRAIASEVKLTLLNQHAPHTAVWIVGAAGVMRTELHTLDHADRFDHLTSLYIAAAPRASGFEAMQELAAHLRAPEGCPWDIEQTHQSLRNTLLEETYEVLDAIDRDDLDNLKEELGDLLFNIIMQAQIATEAERFRMTDVIDHVHAKLIHRHPHVFGDLKLADADAVLKNWERIKKAERPPATSALSGIAPALPALAHGQKMIARAEKAGFKWPSTALRVKKVREELAELLAAPDQDNRFEEFGDLLFTLCNLAVAYHVDAESALRAASLKFAGRFGHVEALVDARGLDMHAMSINALLKLWQQAKREEVGGSS